MGWQRPSGLSTIIWSGSAGDLGFLSQEPTSRRHIQGRGAMTPRAVLGFAGYLLIHPLVLFLAAGTIQWPIAWVYVAMSYAAVIGSRLLLLRRDPDLLRERARSAHAPDAMEWDRPLALIVGALGPVIVQGVAGVDHRLHWPPALSLPSQLLSSVLVGAGYLLAVWAMLSNRYFSAVVRIQKDRGHTVVTAGPYGWVRHPAYLGGLVSGLALPAMLDAAWAWLPAILVALVLVVRTSLEDRALQDGLPGYVEYTRKVRYRLLPLVW